MISLKFIPLSFITSNDEIIKQIKNTVVFSHLFETCKETTLSNYIETTQYGFTASALESGSHRLVRITDIHHSKVNWESVPFCDCNDEEKYLLKDNDILVARTGGTTGKSFFVENPVSNAVFASYLIRIRLKKDVNVEFIKAFLNSYCFWSQIVEMKAGSAQPNVNAEKLKTLVIPECDSETQAKAISLINEENNSNSVRKRINSVETVFWNNNQITTELSHQLELVRQLRQAFLREAMQGTLVSQDDADEPAEILLEKIKAEKAKLIAEKKIKKDKTLPEIKPEEIPFEIPNNWTWCRLGEITNYGNSFKAEPSDLSDETWILDLEDIEKETSRLLEKVRFADRNSLSTKSIFRKGNVLYSKLRPYLDKVIVADEDGVCTTEILPLNTFAEMNPYFLRFTLKRSDFLKYVNSVTKGMKMPRLGTKEGQLALIPLPPLAEQKRIVEKLEKLMKYCDELEANIRTSKGQAESLLQVALKEALEPK